MPAPALTSALRGLVLCGSRKTAERAIPIPIEIHAVLAAPERTIAPDARNVTRPGSADNPRSVNGARIVGLSVSIAEWATIPNSQQPRV